MSTKITGYAPRFRKSDGSKFFVFNLTGSPVARKSSTGKLSLVIPQATCPAGNITDETILKQMVGEKIDGAIVWEPCAPYTFKGTDGADHTATHRWVYSADGATAANAAVVEQPVAVEEF